MNKQTHSCTSGKMMVIVQRLANDWNISTTIHLLIDYSYLHPAVRELSSWDRDCMAHRPKHILSDFKKKLANPIILQNNFAIYIRNFKLMHIFVPPKI